MSRARTERLTAVFEGRVQSVGFRWTSARAAREAGVVGWVINEPDGSVRLVAEGTDDQLDALLTLIRTQMVGNIERERADRSAATGEFTSFEIRR